MKLHSFANSADSGCPTRRENWQHLAHASAVFTHRLKELITMEINLLTPNVNYSGRTARLTSKVAFYIFIQQI